MAHITCESVKRHLAKLHSELKYLGRTLLKRENMLFVLEAAWVWSGAGTLSSDWDIPFMSLLAFIMEDGSERSLRTANMWMVPLSEEQETYLEVGSKLKQ